MENNFVLLPERAQYMLGYMKKNNWLTSYASIEGMCHALSGLSKRTKFESRMEEAPKFLVEHYVLFEKHFEFFFEELVKQVAKFTRPPFSL